MTIIEYSILFLYFKALSHIYSEKMGHYNTNDAKLVIALISVILIGMAKSYPNSVPNSPDVCSKMTPGIDG